MNGRQQTIKKLIILLIIIALFAGAMSITATAANNNRYSGVKITNEEMTMLYKLVAAEARGESALGQQMVAEVVLNRVMHKRFPNSVSKVINQRGQFSTAKKLSKMKYTQAQVDAVKAALRSQITTADVVYFGRKAQRGKTVFRRVGNHVFCKI